MTNDKTIVSFILIGTTAQQSFLGTQSVNVNCAHSNNYIYRYCCQVHVSFPRPRELFLCSNFAVHPAGWSFFSAGGKNGNDGNGLPSFQVIVYQ